MPGDKTSNKAQAKSEELTFGRERPVPGAYYLDLSTVAMLPLKVDGQTSTFADIYRKLMDAKVVKVPE